MAAKVKGLGDRVSGEKELQTLAKQVQSATGEVIASAQQAQQLQDDKSKHLYCFTQSAFISF